VGSRRFPAVIAAALIVASFAPSARAAPGSIASAKQKAAALAAQIEAQGERLSMADERYNAAAYRSQELDASVAKAHADAAVAEKRWSALRRRLAQRVKTLYMHPGAPFAAWLSMRSLSEDARARVLSDSVLTSDSNLVSETDRARRDVRQKARQLSALRTDAQRNLETVAAERGSVASNLATQRALLSNVRGDIATLIEADRRKKLAEASRRAAVTSPSAPEPTKSPAGGSSQDNTAPPPPPAPAPSAGAAKAVSVAQAQIGKPYQWAAAGPDKFDCSGLTMYAWAAAGVQLPHSAAAQYGMLPKVSRAALQPGDLVAFGNPIHHIGIYEGGGIMIDAPQTGENVRRDAIDRADYVGGVRP
jgi:cell wall-associated NlpC family hydrolase